MLRILPDPVAVVWIVGRYPVIALVRVLLSELGNQRHELDLLQRAQSYQNLIRGARLAVFSRMTVAGRQPTLFPEAS